MSNRIFKVRKYVVSLGKVIVKKVRKYVVSQGVNATFNNISEIFSYIVAVSFIGGGNRNTRRKPPT